MAKFYEQCQRFDMVLRAKEEYSINCEKCPINKECFDWSSKMSIEEAENGPTCEEILLHYILTGEKPQTKE